MTKVLFFACVASLAPRAGLAQDAASGKARAIQATAATFMITGLHCPPCTKTVSNALENVNGVVQVKVDWKSKNALVVFDENRVPAQRIGRIVAQTPHMMGGGLHYAAWLVLRSSDIKDDASQKKAQDAVARLPEVKQAVAYADRGSLAVLFKPDGSLTTAELVECLARAGIRASAK